jgi:hypothetical protein
MFVAMIQVRDPFLVPSMRSSYLAEAMMGFPLEMGGRRSHLIHSKERKEDPLH